MKIYNFCNAYSGFDVAKKTPKCKKRFYFLRTFTSMVRLMFVILIGIQTILFSVADPLNPVYKCSDGKPSLSGLRVDDNVNVVGFRFCFA